MPLTCPDALREYRKRYYAANKGKASEKFKNWLSKNPNYMREWKAKNAEKVAQYRKVSRSQPFARFTRMGLGLEDAKALLEKKAHGCVLCGSDGPFHLDHIVPKSRGGTNAFSNLQWLCATCNTSKGALTTDEFLAHIRKILARG